MQEREIRKSKETYDKHNQIYDIYRTKFEIMRLKQDDLLRTKTEQYHKDMQAETK